MNIKPILFSTPMVQAIMEDRKEMTRRVIKFKSIYQNEHGNWNYEYKNHAASNQDRESINDDFFGLKHHSPYGSIGDILYVRESYYAYGIWVKDGKTKKGNQKWKFQETGNHYEYEGSPVSHSIYFKSRDKGNSEKPHWYKRLGRFMPKAAARIWSEITDVKVERLFDITEEEAVKEGVQPNWLGDLTVGRNGRGGEGWAPEDGWYHYMRDVEDFPAFTAIESFESLWELINGRGSWDSNPWVWVVSFKVLSKTGKPDNI